MNHLLSSDTTIGSPRPRGVFSPFLCALVPFLLGTLQANDADAERRACRIEVESLKAFRVVLAEEDGQRFTVRVDDAKAEVAVDRRNLSKVSAALNLEGRIEDSIEFNLGRELTLVGGAVRIPRGARVSAIFEQRGKLRGKVRFGAIQAETVLGCGDIRFGPGQRVFSKKSANWPQSDGTRWVAAKRPLEVYRTPGKGQRVNVTLLRKVLFHRAASRGAWVRVFHKLGRWGGIDGWVKASDMREYVPPTSTGGAGGLGSAGFGGRGRGGACHPGLTSPATYRGPAKVALSTPVHSSRDGEPWATVNTEETLEVSWERGSDWVALEIVPGFRKVTADGRCFDRLTTAWVRREAVTFLEPVATAVEPDAPSPSPALTPLEDVAGVATGAAHSCAWTNDGDVLCWGDNDHGQLGDGTKASRARPVAVGLDGPAEEVAAGAHHTCARLRNGTVACWGSNTEGQVTGREREATNPVTVGELRGVKQLATGDHHTCALLRGGRVKCWGVNRGGQLGDGTRKSGRSPVEARGFGGATAITAGREHTCALLGTGIVLCWGRMGSHGRRMVEPTKVDSVSNAVDIDAGGARSCAVSSTGTVRCWGLGLIAKRSAEIEGLDDAVEIELGQRHACARSKNGQVSCWGHGEGGQLGDGSWQEREAPTTVDGLSDVTAISAGWNHTCARRRKGRLVCWGMGTMGQLGNLEESLARPRLAKLAGPIAQLVAGRSHTCARRPNGQVLCFGDNSKGQVGSGASVTEHLEPVAVEGLDDATDVAASHEGSCAVRKSGETHCWGHFAGQRDDDTPLSPVKVLGLPGAVDVEMGNGFACARTKEGAVWCWGSMGRRGVAGGGHTAIPLEVATKLPVKEMAFGAGHACLRHGDGTVSCWGVNSHGQLILDRRAGRQLQVDSPGPITVDGPVKSITAGAWHTCLLRESGSVTCMGRNDRGQIGDGTNSRPYRPQAAVGLADAREIVASQYATCALRRNGTLACWGALTPATTKAGIDAAIARFGPTPVSIEGLGDLQTIGGGANHICTSDGERTWCWGSNDQGQLGVGSRPGSSTPTPVLIDTRAGKRR